MTSSLPKEWDRVAEPLGKIALAGERVRYAAAIKPLLLFQKDALILEAGCGAGRILRALDTLGYQNIVGLEISFARLKDVSRRGQNSAMLVNSGGVPFASNTFDAVVSAAVIEHITNPADWLFNLAQVTKPGGIVSIVTDTYMWLWLKKMGLYRSIQPLDEAIWPGMLIQWGQRAGLELYACGGFINTPDQYGYFFKQLLSLLPKTGRLRRWLNRRPLPAIPSDEVQAILEAVDAFPNQIKINRWDCIWLFECFYWFRKR